MRAVGSKDLRIDLPTVGLRTLNQCKLAGLKGIVIKNKQNTKTGKFISAIKIYRAILF